MAFSKTEGIYIGNLNGNKTAQFNMTTTIDDVGDACDPTGDVSVVAEYKGVEINDGDTFIIVEGSSQVEITSSILDNACPLPIVVIIYLD